MEQIDIHPRYLIIKEFNPRKSITEIGKRIIILLAKNIPNNVVLLTKIFLIISQIVFIGSIELSPRRIRIMSMAIRLSNPAILIMNYQFSSLVLANFTGNINRLFFCSDMGRSAIGTAPFNVPPAIRVMYYMM